MNTLTCKHCFESFEDNRPQNTRGRKPTFCTDVCRQRFRNAAQEARRTDRRQMGTCIDCAAPATHRDCCLVHHAQRQAASVAQRLRRYNLTAERYAALYVEQRGLCAICRTSETGKSFAVDHDHACCAGDTSCGNCVRGLLCAGCNTGIGIFGDDVVRLASAIEYLGKVR